MASPVGTVTLVTNSGGPYTLNITTYPDLFVSQAVSRGGVWVVPQSNAGGVFVPIQQIQTMTFVYV